ncbi:profilin-2-like [Stegostoma tigrinum]|uniref:profilin-2-like n=1 Tax=Stegostoma tigrinum TaxID=3053191 RepID=UPI00202B4C4C|nr:profilin-2-like [Stegostoma tigrinum]
MSSWPDYVNRLMAHDGVAEVAIVGQECKTIWAASENSNLGKIKAEQVASLLGNLNNLQTNGVTLGDQKYTFVRKEEDDSIPGGWSWLTLSSKNENKTSVIVQKTCKVLIIMESKTNQTKGTQLLGYVVATVEHLKSCGY